MDTEFGAALSLLKEYFSRYDNFVRVNPRIAAEIEAIIRWSSYLIATKKSPILGELLSSGANLLQLCNDLILRSTNAQLKLDLRSYTTQLKTFLAVVQSLELLAEIYVRETYGNVAKWAIITAVQVLKATIKLILLLGFEEGLSISQPIVPLDRIHFTEIARLTEKYNSRSEDFSDNNESSISEIPQTTTKSITLKSSGRRMRSITESLPRESCFREETKGPENTAFERLQRQRLHLLVSRYREQESAKLSDRQLYGEILHIARPVAHLLAMGTLGSKSWLPYLTSLTMDVSSLYLLRSPSPLACQARITGGSEAATRRYQFNLNERMELGQRASSLLLYLLRSPFFDEYTKEKALGGLACSSERIPLIGRFLATFFNYIPDWQQDYFRVWSN